MALKLDNSLLEELGLGALPDPEKQLLLRQIYEKLEMNVGMRLADQMSNEQLDAFEQFVDANDDKGAFKWLESNFPNYKDVVNQEFEKLKAEIRSVAPQILASAQQNAAAQQAMPQNTQPPQAAQSGMPPQYGPISPQPGQYGGGGQYGAAPADPNPASGQPPQQYAAPAQPPSHWPAPIWRATGTKPGPISAGLAATSGTVPAISAAAAPSHTAGTTATIIYALLNMPLLTVADGDTFSFT